MSAKRAAEAAITAVLSKAVPRKKGAVSKKAATAEATGEVDTLGSVHWPEFTLRTGLNSKSGRSSLINRPSAMHLVIGWGFVLQKPLEL